MKLLFRCQQWDVILKSIQNPNAPCHLAGTCVLFALSRCCICEMRMHCSERVTLASNACAASTVRAFCAALRLRCLGEG